MNSTIVELPTAGLRFVERKCQLPAGGRTVSGSCAVVKLALQQRWEIHTVEPDRSHYEWRDVPIVTLKELEENSAAD